MLDGIQESHNRFRNDMSSRAGSDQQSSSPTSCNDPRVMTCSRRHARRSVIFILALHVHRYPPAVWGDDEEVDDDDEWDVGCYKDEDPFLAEEAALAERERRGGGDSDDGKSLEEARADPSRAHGPPEEQRRQQELPAQQIQQELQKQQEGEQQAAQQHQQQQRQQIEEQHDQQEVMAETMAGQASATSTQAPGRLSISQQGSREQLVLPQDSSSVSPSSSSTSARFMDPIDASERKKTSLRPLLVRDGD